MSFNNALAPTPEKYLVPVQNASSLRYGAPRLEARRQSEHRRPSSARQGNKDITAYAASYPHGTGLGLTDQDLMILCFLPNLERHRRATSVFNSRGEWYAKYKQMTTKDDAFLASVGMPRDAVPRTAGDRPSRRNEAQFAMEEDTAQRRADATHHPDLGYAGDGPYQDIPPQVLQSVSTGHSLTLSLFNKLIKGGVSPPAWTMELTFVSDYSETKALEYLLPNSPANMLFEQQIQINFKTRFNGLCSSILRAFKANLSEPDTTDLYVGNLYLKWQDSRTGRTDFIEIFAHNWRSQIVPFLTSEFVQPLALRFGLYVVDEWDIFGNLIESGEDNEGDY